MFPIGIPVFKDGLLMDFTACGIRYFSLSDAQKLQKFFSDLVTHYTINNISEVELKCKNRYLSKKYEEECAKIVAEYKREATKDDLYLIADTDTNSLKIGRSKNPKNRIKQIQGSSVNSLVLLYSIEHKGCLERELHKEFSQYRISKEWFYDNDLIRNRFKGLSE